MKTAIIDLGTNSIRFDIYEFQADYKPRRIYRNKNMVRIGEKVFKSNQLTEKAMARTVTAVKEFSQILADEAVDKVIAFSTCALREADNANIFIEKVKLETGISFEVITGQEEARLISKGILSNESVPMDGAYALIDIGGGSTEISLCYKRTVLKQQSLALGSSRLTQMFSSDGLLPTKSRKEMRRYIRTDLSELVAHKLWGSVTQLVCSSGTAKAFFKMAKAQEMPNQPLGLKDLTLLVSDLKQLDRDQLLAYPGMEAKRVDIILAGGVLLQEVARQTGVKNLVLTDYNLRDGIIQQETEAQFSSLLNI